MLNPAMPGVAEKVASTKMEAGRMSIFSPKMCV